LIRQYNSLLFGVIKKLGENEFKVRIIFVSGEVAENKKNDKYSYQDNLTMLPLQHEPKPSKND